MAKKTGNKRMSSQPKLIITVLADNPQSWIMPYAKKLVRELKERGHVVRLAHHQNKMKKGDVAFLLSCERVVPVSRLSWNKHNVVVHESALPQGKGWAPLTWQILEGKNEIPVTLFEAVERVDSGPIYFQENIRFEGHELIGEMRNILGEKTVELCLRFIEHYSFVVGREQVGAESFYPRRRPKDSEVAVNKTIAELFNNFRIADNKRYPAFFRYRGHKYMLRIEKGQD